jgi:hypothetical protein
MQLHVRVGVRGNVRSALLLAVEAALSAVVVLGAATHFCFTIGLRLLQSLDWDAVAACIASRVQAPHARALAAGLELRDGAERGAEARAVEPAPAFDGCAMATAGRSGLARIGIIIIGATAEQLNATMVPPAGAQVAQPLEADAQSSVGATNGTERSAEAGADAHSGGFGANSVHSPLVTFTISAMIMLLVTMVCLVRPSCL